MALVESAGARTFVSVPMLKDGELLAHSPCTAKRFGPFTEKQIELVQNFAAQAVIAIENTRLLNELRQRTDDLAEALEQQTATSEVLKVISSSPGELEPVFQAMLENATRICEAKFGVLVSIRGRCVRCVAHARRTGPHLLRSGVASQSIRPRPDRQHSARVASDKAASSDRRYAKRDAAIQAIPVRASPSSPVRGQYLPCRCSRTTS